MPEHTISLNAEQRFGELAKRFDFAPSGIVYMYRDEAAEAVE